MNFGLLAVHCKALLDSWCFGGLSRTIINIPCGRQNASSDSHDTTDEITCCVLQNWFKWITCNISLSVQSATQKSVAMFPPEVRTHLCTTHQHMNQWRFVFLSNRVSRERTYSLKRNHSRLSAGVVNRERRMTTMRSGPTGSELNIPSDEL